MTEETAPGGNEFCLGMMELEAEEMLFTGTMKEKLWIKCLDEKQYRQFIHDELDARIKTLDRLIEVWEEV